MFALAEEAVPEILSSKSMAIKFHDELKRHHRWFGVIFHYSTKLPRILRVISLASNVIIMLFMQSVTYNFTKEDDGTCQTYTTETTCLAPSSTYLPGQHKCYWTAASTNSSASSDGICAFY